MEQQRYDFSGATVRCSRLYDVMCQPKDASPKQKYEKLLKDLDNEREKYKSLDERKRGMASGISIAQRIVGYEELLISMEKDKDVDTISSTAKSYLNGLYGELKYGKQSLMKSRGNKFTDKGTLAEPDAISLISKLDGCSYLKNEIEYRNEYITGTPDIVYNTDENKLYIVDVKCSWDWETFAANIGEQLNSSYWWQVQGYMWLTGAELSEISYCLVNLPDVMIYDEMMRLNNKMMKDLQAIDLSVYPEYRLAEAQLVSNITFDNIPTNERRYKIIVKRDDEAISKIPYQVEKCRKYLAEFQELHLLGQQFY